MGIPFFEVSADEIISLNEIQLRELIQELLEVEMPRTSGMNPFIHVGTNENAGDGGEDAKIQWVGGLEKTGFFPSRQVCFQLKATPMSIAACKDEMFIIDKTTKARTIKPRIKAVLDAGGSYVQICNRKDLPLDKVEQRESGMISALKQYFPNRNLVEDIKFYDANKLMRWVNGSPSVAIYVKRLVGKLDHQGKWRTWDEIHANHQKLQEIQLIETNSSKMLLDLVQTIGNSSNRIIRVEGLPGLGKTRIVKEVLGFQNSNATMPLLSKKSVLYRDLGGRHETDVIDQVYQISRGKSSTFFILDNCPLSIHEQIDRSFHSSVNDSALITIGEVSKRQVGENHIQLNTNENEIVVKAIVDKLARNLPQNFKDKIIELSGGFPFFAGMIIADPETHGLNGSIDLGAFEEGLFNRLISIDDEFSKSDVKKVITVLSLFDQTIHYEEESRFIDLVEHPLFCNLGTSSGGDPKTTAKTIIKRFQNKGIIESIGRMITVKPKPLAVRLFQDWLDSIDEEDLNKAIQYLTENHLLPQFCRQIEFLGQSPNAKAFAMRVCGGNRSPLSNAEGLMSEWGSQLFSALTIVNPEATAELIHLYFSDPEEGKAQEIPRHSRSRLLYGLERLAFDKSTFDKAARTLLAFAVDETEHVFANNSRNTFLRLFHIYMAGTEANLEARKVIVEYALASGLRKVVQIGVEALGSCISTEFMRFSDAEFRGAKAPLVDYRPTREEMRGYCMWVAETCWAFADTSSENCKLIQQMLPLKFGAIIHLGALPLFIKGLKTLAKKLGETWSEARRELAFVLEIYHDDLSQEDQKALEEIHKLISPQLLPMKIKAVFSEGIRRRRKHVFDEKENPEYTEALALSVELSNGNDWLEHLAIVVEGEQRWTYLLGKMLGENWHGDWAVGFDRIYHQLKVLPPENLNLDFIKGILSGIGARDIAWAFLDQLSQTDQLSVSVPSLLAHYTPEDQEFSIVLIWLEEGRFPSHLLDSFEYTSGWKNATPKGLINFWEAVSQRGEQECWLILKLMAIWILNGNDPDNMYSKLGLRLFERIGITIIGRTWSKSGMTWSFWAEKLLADSESERVLSFLSNEIGYYYANAGSSDFFDPPLIEIYHRILKEGFRVCWPILGPYMTGPIMSLNRILNITNDDFFDRNNPIFNQEAEFIFDWLQDRDEKEIIGLAKVMPLEDEQDISRVHPFTKEFIGRFGYLESVRTRIACRLHSYMAPFPIAPFLNKKKLWLENFSAHNDLEVRKWAKKEISRFNLEIRQAALQDEEHGYRP